MMSKEESRFPGLLFIIILCAPGMIHTNESCTVGSTDGDPLSNLIFAVDVSKDMKDVLPGIMNKSLEIINSLANISERTFEDFVFITFSKDSGVLDVLHGRNVDEFKHTFSTIKVKEEGDARPTSSLAAIKKALEVGLPKSNIFVFTETPPKDADLLPDVLSLIEQKHSQVSIFMRRFYKSSEYEKITNASRGQTFFVVPSGPGLLLNFTTWLTQANVKNLIDENVVPSSESSTDTCTAYSSSVENITDLMLSVGVAAKPFTLKLFDEDGNEVMPTFKSSTDMIFFARIQNPQFKKLAMKVCDSHDYTIRLRGVQTPESERVDTVDFSYGFSISSNRNTFIDGLSAVPFGGGENTLYVMPSSTPGNDSATPTHCELISSNRSVIECISLSPLQNWRDDLPAYYGSFDTASLKEDFYLKVHGTTAQGSVFSRRISQFIQPDPTAIIVWMPQNRTLFLNSQTQLYCNIESTLSSVVYWVKGGKYFDVAKPSLDTEDYYTLPIPRVFPRHAGNYTCCLTGRACDWIQSKQTVVDVV